MNFLEDYFVVLGVGVTAANRIEDAYLALKHQPFDLLITDLHLPDLSGADGLDLIRFTKDRSPATEAILITGDSNPEIESEAYRSGATFFLRKPFSLEKLELKLIQMGIISDK